MKKIIGLCFLLGICVSVLSAFANQPPEIKIDPLIKRGSMEKLFSTLGLDINRNLYLLMEVNGLVEYRKTSLGRNRLYRLLKKYDFTKDIGSKLPHIHCKTGSYEKLNHNFYSQLGSVIPLYNTIDTYSITSLPGKVFTVGSGDIDRYADNCQGSTIGKDDKTAGCTLRMRHYFATSSFELLSCK